MDSGLYLFLTLPGLVAIAAIDVTKQKIPNLLLVFFTALLCINLFLDHQGPIPWSTFKYGLSGIIVAVALTFPGWLLHRLGGGDVKLSMLLGAFLGPMGFLWSVVLAVPFGLIFFLYHRLAGKAVPADLPVGAFLAGGASIVLITAAWPLL